MGTCAECGGTVQDNVCIDCGANVWPGAESGHTEPGGMAPAPPPPSSGGGGGPASDSAGPVFVNAPASTPPPPPPPSDTSPPPPGGADPGWQQAPAAAGPGGTNGSSKRTLWWVLGGLAVLGMLGVLAVFLLLRGVGLSAGDFERVGEGSPERLAELRSSCGAGDMQACDDLYLESPFDSEEETFGDTCGGRNEPAGWCVDVHGETAPPN